MSNKQIRQLTRLLHIVTGSAIGLFIYGPWGDGSWLEVALQVVIFPSLVVSGLIMWQQPRLSRLRRGWAGS